MNYFILQIYWNNIFAIYCLFQIKMIYDKPFRQYVWYIYIANILYNIFAMYCLFQIKMINDCNTYLQIFLQYNIFYIANIFSESNNIYCKYIGQYICNIYCKYIVQYICNILFVSNKNDIWQTYTTICLIYIFLQNILYNIFAMYCLFQIKND